MDNNLVNWNTTSNYTFIEWTLDRIGQCDRQSSSGMTFAKLYHWKCRDGYGKIVGSDKCDGLQKGPEVQECVIRKLKKLFF